MIHRLLKTLAFFIPFKKKINKPGTARGKNKKEHLSTKEVYRGKIGYMGKRYFPQVNFIFSQVTLPRVTAANLNALLTFVTITYFKQVAEEGQGLMGSSRERDENVSEKIYGCVKQYLISYN